ncbi:SusC/RagA family TonB-linked outer membrane protein [Anditalea andensis]|uniref:TonB-dependent receptor n=1 Tax=Anditalea andensis TaxID=1048983 RepID=A0A074KZH2_9BACT|nr:TonB-dependent receptor [Anditalea andensis]KEO74319.1 TonB-dependent receptor [Anditalea andensis]
MKKYLQFVLKAVQRMTLCGIFFFVTLISPGLEAAIPGRHTKNNNKTSNSGIASVQLPDYLIKGKIIDEDSGEPLIGASVMLVGSTKGVVTDLDGSFEMDIPEGSTLRISYLGFKPKEVPVGNQSFLTITLTPDGLLQEVIVVGYGTQTKKEFTGSASSVDGDKLRDLSVQSFDQGLAGRATGVNISQPNGVLNNAPVIRVRGINSISLSSYPLIVVDGIPINTGDVSGNSNVANNPLGDINPADIESIDILKDAASTSIYGSRAAAGVLLITTKRGIKGKPKVTYDVWGGATNAVRLPTMLNAEQFMMIKNEAVLNAKILGGNEFNENVAAELFFPSFNADGTLVDTNWYDHVYQTGTSQNHNLSVSGGSETTTYFFSANYSNQEGILKTNTFERKAVRFNLDHKLNNWLRFSGNVNYNNSLNSSPATGSLQGNAFGLIGSARLAWLTAPNVSPYNPDGSYNITPTNNMGMGNNQVVSNFYNPVPMLDLNQYDSENDRIISNLSLAATPIEGLSFTTTYSIDKLRTENITYNSPVHGPGFASQGLAINVNALRYNWNWVSTASYQRTFNESHNVSLLLGYDIQKFDNSSWGAQRSLGSDVFFNDYQGNFGAIVPTGNFINEFSYLSQFTRLTYDYNKRYFFTMNFRRDGNSALGQERKYGNFGGASFGWSLSDEHFYINSGVSNYLSSIKLRGSWGVVGNGNLTNAFGSLVMYDASLYGNAPTWRFSQAGNPDLGWETSEQTNIGADIGLFNDRFQLDLTYFHNNVNGLILDVPQSPSKGIPGNSILGNVGSMYNKGIEVSLLANLINTGKFSWSATINYTNMKNRVTALAGSDIIGTTSSSAETTNITRVGHSVGSLFGALTEGVNPENGQRVFVNAAGERVQYSHVVPAGQSRWTYLDGSPAAAITAGDFYLLGNTLPKYYGGIDQHFTFGNFDMSVMFTYSGGNYIMNGSQGTWRDQRFWNNSVEVLNRWTSPGDITDMPRVVFGDLLSNGSSWPISANAEKGDFIRLQTASIGYRLPETALRRLGLSSVRVYSQVFNAFVLTRYTGTDPEISSNGNSNTTPGVEKNSVPQGRTFTLGLNIGF